MSEQNNQNQIQGDEQMKEKKASNQKANFFIICVGQGGYNLGNAIKNKIGISNEDILAINMSQADLSQANVSYKYKFGRTEGAGKNRDLSKQEFKNDNTIFNEIVTKFENRLFRPNNIVLVCFSTGGGTGSGVAPMLTTKLTQYFLSKKDNVDLVNMPHVLGIGILPIINAGFDAGEKSYQNSLESLYDINKAVEKKLATFTIINNDIVNENINNVNEIYNIVNNNVAEGLNRFFCELGVSDNNADLQDRLTALDTPGICGIYNISSLERDYNFLHLIQTDPARSLIAEIKNSQEGIENLRKYLSDNSIQYAEEMISQSSPEGKDDVIALFGISGLGKLVEIIKNKLEDLIVRNVKKTNNVMSNSEGFDGIHATASAIKQRTDKRVVDAKEIEDMF